MTCTRPIFKLLVFLAVVAATAAAKADTMVFTLSQPCTDVGSIYQQPCGPYTWSLPSNPVPDSYSDIYDPLEGPPAMGFFYIYNLSVSADGAVPYSTEAIFGDYSFYPELQIEVPSAGYPGGYITLQLKGSSLFSGPPDSPTILAGTYYLGSIGFGGYTLVVVPEPGSFALMATGTLALLGAVRRRFFAA